MKQLPTTTSTLSSMIKENYLYVDKTQHIYNLIQANSKYYFLSRPRRFGKSLLVSTFREIFVGNKELFKDLWIGSSDYGWKKHPVIHLDFSRIDHGTDEELKIALFTKLKMIAKDYGIELEEISTISLLLDHLVTQLAQKEKVIILIDEYDKPILDHLENIEMAKRQRSVLASFFATIKGLDEHLRFVFITGASRVSKTSLFSGMNNLNDITLKPEGSTLLGYTQEELQTYFAEHIELLAQKDAQSKDDTLANLQHWYNGYRFCPNIQTKVYNPFSVLYCLNDLRFYNYWFGSGTPTFLVPIMKREYDTYLQTDKIEVTENNLEKFELEKPHLISLLFQTGYLTINDYDQATGRIKLLPPNFEVDQSFSQFVVSEFSNTDEARIIHLMIEARKALDNNDLKKFCSIIETLFSNIPYSIRQSIPRQESYYHALLQFLCNLMALDAHSEILTNKGRIDMAISTKTRIFLFEFKLNVSPEVALAQIDTKEYYRKYLTNDKKITLVGMSFQEEHVAVHLKYVAKEL